MIQNVARKRKQYCICTIGNQTLACAFENAITDVKKI